MRSMNDTNPIETEDLTEDQTYWDWLAERFETDSMDTGCEFDA